MNWPFSFFETAFFVLDAAVAVVCVVSYRKIKKKYLQKLADSQAQEETLEKTFRETERELSQIRKKVQGQETELHLRRQISEAVKSLGSLVDPQAIKDKLCQFVGQSFPQAKVQLLGPQKATDAVQELLYRQRTTVLIEDTQTDRRFDPSSFPPPVRSVLAAPLVAGRQGMSILRLESEQARSFHQTDVRVLDLFTTLASMALENAELLSQMGSTATRDGLTGLATQALFKERLAEELLRAKRYETPFTLMMLDVDHFKAINDQYGHQAGDAVLTRLASVLAASVREVDTAARYGGEEFVLLFPGLDPALCRDYAEQLRARIEAEQISFEKKTLAVTVSIGMAGFPKDGTAAEDLVKVADQRLYQAKESGRNRVVGEQ